MLYELDLNYFRVDTDILLVDGFADSKRIVSGAVRYGSDSRAEDAYRVCICASVTLY